MGGSKSAVRNSPANIITFCSVANGRLEADAEFAEKARDLGWKLAGFMNPETAMVFNAADGCWYLLDDNFHRVAVA